MMARSWQSGYRAARQSYGQILVGTKLRLSRIEQQAKYAQAAEHSPAMLIRSLFYRLPERFSRPLLEKVELPYWRMDEDWDMLASQTMKYQDEHDQPPALLRVDELVSQFTALLECTGAGLCLLAPPELGLAPSVPGGGAMYCFAERKHGGSAFAIMLVGDSPSNYELYVNGYGDAKAFLVEVGNHPIERLAQGIFPADGKNWYSLRRPEFQERNWPSMPDCPEKIINDLTLSCRLPMHPGSAYLMRAKSPFGTQVVVAFQCFQVENSAKVLLAWRIIDVFAKDENAPEIAVWWQMKGWKALWRSFVEQKENQFVGD